MSRMYRILGRRVVEGGRLGEYVVEFSREWSSGARKIYLIGDFSSVYPGFHKLRKLGNRGYARVYLWWGVYGYGFVVDNDFANIYDPENEARICRRGNFHPDQETCLSRAEISRPQNPLDMIYHYERDEAFLHVFKDRAILRIRHPRDINNVDLEIFNGAVEDKTTYPIGDEAVTQFIVKPHGDIRYRFSFRYSGETLYYGYEGVSENPSLIHVKTRDLPGQGEPFWYSGTIYYQIFVDSFFNGDVTNDPPTKIKVYEPREHGYYGGDLKGIISKIDYIHKLGIETLYLTPIFKSTSYHRYDVIDYYGIDSYIGSMEDFKELVKKLGEIDVRIVLDITPHHCSPCHEHFKDVIMNLENSRFWNWFTIFYKPPPQILDFLREHIVSKDCSIREAINKARSNPALWKWFTENKPFYESFFTTWSMVKFNHDNPETIDYFVDVAKYWIERGVHGFRVDVAMGIFHAWLREYYRRVKELKRDFLLLAEVSESPAVYYECFDSVMFYYLRRLLFERLLYKSISTEEFLEELNKVYMSIPHYKSLALYNLLGSHDTPRLKTIVNGDKELMKILYVLIFTLPGSPAIYYGDEIGMEGGRDPDCRRPMIWDENKWDHEIYFFVKSLIKIYKSYRALRHGFYKLHYLGNDVLMIKRWLDEENIYAILNLSDKEVKVTFVIPPDTYYDPFNNEAVIVRDNLSVDLGRYGFKLLVSSRIHHQELIKVNK